MGEMPLLSRYCVLIMVEPCVRVFVCKPKHGTACCNGNVLDLYSRIPRFVSQARCWLSWAFFSKSLQVILICLWWLHIKSKHVALNYPVYKKSREWGVLPVGPPCQVHCCVMRRLSRKYRICFALSWQDAEIQIGNRAADGYFAHKSVICVSSVIFQISIDNNFVEVVWGSNPNKSNHPDPLWGPPSPPYTIRTGD